MFNLSFAEKKNRGETHRQGHKEKGMERELRELQTIGERDRRTDKETNKKTEGKGFTCTNWSNEKQRWSDGQR